MWPCTATEYSILLTSFSYACITLLLLAFWDGDRNSTEYIIIIVPIHIGHFLVHCIIIQYYTVERSCSLHVTSTYRNASLLPLFLSMNNCMFGDSWLGCAWNDYRFSSPWGQITKASSTCMSQPEAGLELGCLLGVLLQIFFEVVGNDGGYGGNPLMYHRSVQRSHSGSGNIIIS